MVMERVATILACTKIFRLLGVRRSREHLHAQKLQAAGRPYELILYHGDDHSLSANKQDSNRRIAEWFRKHMK
jgi:hypothetical protein